MTTLIGLLDELNFDDLPSEETIEKIQHSDKIRGPLQRHFGYASNYSLTRQKEEDGGHVCPRVLGDGVPVKWQDRFRIMTEIADIIYNQEGRRSNQG